nr:hypothetical protein [uncultured Ottowia sp.]
MPYYPPVQTQPQPQPAVQAQQAAPQAAAPKPHAGRSASGQHTSGQRAPCQRRTLRGRPTHLHRPCKPPLQAQRRTPAALAITRTLAAQLPPAVRMGAWPSKWLGSKPRKKKQAFTNA